MGKVTGKYRFVCNRKVENKAKELTGRVKVYVPKEENTVYGEYTCAECGHKGKVEQEWKRPFNVKCEKCGFLMRVPKLKDQVKREKKRAKK